MKYTRKSIYIPVDIEKIIVKSSKINKTNFSTTVANFVRIACGLEPVRKNNKRGVKKK